MQRGRRHLWRARRAVADAMRGLLKRAPARGVAVSVLIALSLLGLGQAAAQSTRPRIYASPSLFPAFDPHVPDYAVRCRRGRPVRVSVSAQDGVAVAVNGARARGGRFSAEVRVSSGQAFRFRVRSGRRSVGYTARCLPPDFPKWSVSRPGRPQAQWYVVAPCCTSRYAAIFDTNGVPVWWMRMKRQVLDASLLPNHDVAIAVVDGLELAKGVTPAIFSEYRLDGRFVRTFTIPGGRPTDRHELQVLPNGDYLVVADVPRNGVDLSPYGGPSDATVLDAMIAEVSPKHRIVWSWNSKDHIGLAETGSRWYHRWVLPNPGRLPDGRKAYDIVHINAVAPYGAHHFLVSLRHTDAVYAIDRSTGDVEWKLGGTQTPQSLSIVGDDVPDFGGQHDVRDLPDGTVTLFDNGTYRGRPPRALRFAIDAQARTATLLERLVGTQTPSSPCCGSARKLPGGDWVVSWGGTHLISELTPDDQPVFELNFPTETSYRAPPVLPGVLTWTTLDAAMDRMHPR